MTIVPKETLQQHVADLIDSGSPPDIAIHAAAMTFALPVEEVEQALQFGEEHE
jgi:hypothetical protein